MALPSPFERLIGLLKRLPGVGEKSARRMAFFVFQAPDGYARELADALFSLKDALTVCHICGNLTDRQPCHVCSDPLRDRSILCVVEGIEDLLSIEQAGVYDGLYYVLGGSVSPLDGRDIPSGVLERLLDLVNERSVSEVIIATNPRVEGDMTYHAVLAALRPLKTVKKTRLAYGLPVGGSIEFADRVTLHAAMDTRIVVQDDGR